jgi:hypothetical protein
MQLIVAAISLGFIGSFHCIGMCGPIAMSLPVHNKTGWQKNIAILAYNFGRILTYSLLGLLFGLLGQSVVFFGYQQLLSVISGALILIWLLLPQSPFSRGKWIAAMYKLLSKLKNAIALQFQKKGIRSFFSIGLLNGLLPCGLVYIALAGSVAAGSMAGGALFMAAFGAGTIPFMFAISFSSHLIGTKFRSVIRKTMPFTIGAMALLLILRGSNLGIPYLSPKLTETKTTAGACKQSVTCCHKK